MYAGELYEHFQKLEESEYFLHKLHFVEDHIIRYADYTSEMNLFTERSDVWMISSQKVKKMIEFVFPQLWGNGPRYSFRGAGAVYGNGCDNCLTWARAKLQETDVFIGERVFDKIIAIPRFYTQYDLTHKIFHKAIPQV